MTPQQFGDKLRRERERRGVSLQSVASSTKIGRMLLIDLEKGNCSRWPGGIYARAYVRAYAGALGLDPEELVSLFCDVFPEFAPAPAVEPVSPETGDGSARRGRFAQLRDLLHRAESRLDLFFRVERSE